MLTIHAATTNAGKLAEFAACARGEEVTVLALPGLSGMQEPAEDSATFMGNAEGKAVAYSRLALASAQRRLLVFADDSGLEVDALGGEPGVRSARFADDLGFESDRPDTAATRNDRNMRCLLSRLSELPTVLEGRSNHAARFVCALALVRDGEVLLRAEGKVEGQIVDAPRGQGGFGYDPVFLVPSLGLTLAEMGREQKWAVSHRGNAFRSLLLQLRDSRL